MLKNPRVVYSDSLTLYRHWDCSCFSTLISVRTFLFHSLRFSDVDPFILRNAYTYERIGVQISYFAKTERASVLNRMSRILALILSRVSFTFVNITIVDVNIRMFIQCLLCIVRFLNNSAAHFAKLYHIWNPFRFKHFSMIFYRMYAFNSFETFNTVIYTEHHIRGNVEMKTQSTLVRARLKYHHAMSCPLCFGIIRRRKRSWAISPAILHTLAKHATRLQ